MRHVQRLQSVLAMGLLLALLGGYTLYAWTSLPVEDDPLVRLPGTQPGQVTLEGINRCTNCHGGYDEAVEPVFNWQGSMMAQAARDYLFWACMVVAGQDSTWAIGRPNAVDICERCHFPNGWLEGRSDPTNASLMTGSDYDGVQCDFCHSLYDPFFEGTYNLAREGDLNGDGAVSAAEWRDYWDETNTSGTPSLTAAADTYAADLALSADITLFDGDSFYGAANLPFSLAYDESGAGQYFVSTSGDKRASFSDATGRHGMLYSRYHKSKYFCNTCHDVSNPVLANLGQDGTQPLTTETDPAYSYFHVERTSSEFMLSAYSQEGGAAGIGPYAPDQFETSYPTNYIAKCQDCHMSDRIGKGADMKDAPVRPTESTEHPNSGQPQHDLTGGNVWVSLVLASSDPGSPNYDATNSQLLNQGPALLTLDMTQGDGFDPVALLSGADRAHLQLVQAAAIEDLSYEAAEGWLSFRIQNQTGHKLISGFPEGRRMFVNVKAYSGGELLHEVNPYDDTVGTLKGLPATYSANSPALAPGETYVDELVYEMHPSSTLTGESETFHFALADGRYKDNRIPPMGFRIDEAPDRLSQPVWHGVDAPGYFTAEEYAGGYDRVDLEDYGISIPGADYVEVRLYYQTTSREYVEFLRDEINGDADTLPPEAYIVQDDPFFAQLRAWGDTIWQLWDHNKDLPGAAPFQMAQATIGVVPPPVASLTDAGQSVSESDSTVTVTVELNRAAGTAVTVPYTVGGTATGGGTDHDLAGGLLQIIAGTLSASVNFQVENDPLYERDETAIVTLGAPSGALLGTPAVQTITILDNDDPPELAFSSATYTVLEVVGDGSATITVTLTGATALTATVGYATTDGSALHGEDYVAASGTLTFTPGVTIQTFSVPILDDDQYENDETVGLALNSPVSATLGLTSATLTIANDDSLPTVELSSATYSVAETGGSATITATLSGVASLTATVDYATNDATATHEEDFIAVTGTLTFTPGVTIRTFSVPILDDGLYEGDETFGLSLNSPVSASLGLANATLTIADNDPMPAVDLSSATYSIEESGGSATITATLSNASAFTATVGYATTDATATLDEDYVAASGTLTFTTGVTSQAFSVPILGDDLYEGDETVGLSLNTPVSATLGLAIATLTIIDDDPMPAFSINDVATSEDGGSMTFLVSLSVASGLDAGIDYQTNDGTAMAGVDYLAASGTLTLTAGTTERQLSVDLIDNLVDDGARALSVVLSQPVNASLDKAQGVGTILDNDGPPELSFSSTTYGISEAGGQAIITVTLTGTTAGTVRVDYAPDTGLAAGTATPGEDYVPANGNLVFAPGTNALTFTVPILTDEHYEADETAGLTLRNADGADLGLSTATLTIVDDDPRPELAFSSTIFTVDEAGGSAAITVTLTGATALTATVDYATSSGQAAGTATPDEDYISASGTLTFSPSTAQQSFYVPILGDDLYEGDETLGLTLSNAGEAILGLSAATLTITDDDPLPAISIGDVAASEGSGAMTFDISLSAISGQEVLADYATHDGTAAAGQDYVSTSGTLAISPGDTIGHVVVDIVPDDLYEYDETLSIVLQDPADATLDKDRGSGTIQDDDSLPEIAIGSGTYQVAEAQGSAAITVTLTGASALTATVDYATSGGTATPAQDYVSAGGTLTFTPGVGLQAFSITILDDDLQEGKESVSLALSNVQTATLGAAGSILSIIDDDADQFSIYLPLIVRLQP